MSHGLQSTTFVPPALAVRKLMQELVQPKPATEREEASLQPAEAGEAGAGRAVSGVQWATTRGRTVSRTQTSARVWRAHNRVGVHV